MYDVHKDINIKKHLIDNEKEFINKDLEDCLKSKNKEYEVIASYHQKSNDKIKQKEKQIKELKVY